MGPKRHNLDREVLPEMSGGQEEQQKQVGTQECPSNTELEGGCGQGQECHEGRGPQDDSQRADPELQVPLMNHTEKRLREAPTRVGHRRVRKMESDSSDDDEKLELIRRGASTLDCKRRCENSGVS